MNAINFVTRSRAGEVNYGVVPSGEQSTGILVADGLEVSLNLHQSDLRGYSREGSDLVVTLADGRVIVLENYFQSDGTPAARLFLSSDGALTEVSFESGSDGILFANYGPSEAWGKWSPSDALIFADRPTVVAAAPIVDDGSEVSMLAAGLLGSGGLGTLLGAGAATGAAAALLGGGRGGTGTSDDTGGTPAGALAAIRVVEQVAAATPPRSRSRPWTIPIRRSRLAVTAQPMRTRW